MGSTSSGRLCMIFPSFGVHYNFKFISGHKLIKTVLMI